MLRDLQEDAPFMSPGESEMQQPCEVIETELVAEPIGQPREVSRPAGRRHVRVQLDVTERVKLKQELEFVKSALGSQIASKTLQLQEANRQLLIDLADRLKAEVALRDSENQLRAIFENALDSMIVLDDDRRILDGNDSAQELFGMSLQAMKEARWDDMLPAELLESMDQRWESFVHGGSKRGEIEVRRADGQPRLVAFSSRPNILPGRHLMTLRDITGHREAEDALRLLSHRLMHLQEEERRRIARELHDSSGQCLAALQIQLDAIRSAAPDLPAKAKKALDEAAECCQTCTKDIRTISYLLHPPMLDEVGLLPALRWYVEGFSERSGIRITEEISEPGSPLSRDLNTALFRIIQEALTNIHKHADSKEAKIRLHTKNGFLILRISDNGKGFDPERLRRRHDGVSGLGVGITGMRERVRQLGGTLEIVAANPGTMVLATFPVTEDGTEWGAKQGGEGWEH